MDSYDYKDENTKTIEEVLAIVLIRSIVACLDTMTEEEKKR